MTEVSGFSGDAVRQLLAIAGVFLLALYFVVRAAVAHGIRAARPEVEAESTQLQADRE